MSKFKIGDMVYCQAINNKISKITKANEDNYVFLNKAGWFKNTGLNGNGMPIILHATQENYELLSKLYPNVAFEPPPNRKEPKEIIKAMLESGWEYVVVENDECHFLVFDIDLDDDRDLKPFDPKTGKVIIDFVGGKVVLESGNADE